MTSIRPHRSSGVLLWIPSSTPARWDFDGFVLGVGDVDGDCEASRWKEMRIRTIYGHSVGDIRPLAVEVSGVHRRGVVNRRVGYARDLERRQLGILGTYVHRRVLEYGLGEFVSSIKVQSVH